jgi:TPR repeat protein
MSHFRFLFLALLISIAQDTLALARSADELLIVDCLLPGQIRKLGQRMTYLTARQAIKTSAQDCEIRGGEYIAYDRANYATALKVWLPLAEGGDPQAQTYVGEIYEKGLGTSPDYAQAATWYRKAADQGYTRAQINLGYLYEKGLGVPKDPATALNWYRKSSGANVEVSLDSGEVQVLKQELSDRKRAEEALRKELEEAHRQMEKAQQELRRLKNKTEAEQLQLEGARKALEQQKQQAAVTGDQKRIQRLESQLGQREEALKREQTRVERLTAEAQSYQTKITALEKQKQQPLSSSPQQVTIAGPTIEIIEPPVSLTRSTIPRIKTRGGIERPIIGKVSAPSGLLSLTVNEREEDLDNKGLFRVKVPVMRGDTTVHVVAVDRQGKRASAEFILIPEQPSTAVADAEEPPAPEASGPLLLPPGEFGPYYALVIGNNNYTRLPKLDMAVSDATAVADILNKRYGFKTTLLLNANRYQILSALSTLRGQLTDKDNLLIYYAGHGELDKVNQRGHWLPVDAEPTSPANWISNIEVTDTLNVMSAKHVLVIADSCYSGALTRSAVTRLEAGMSRGAQINWFKTMTKKRSRMVLTSGGLEPVLDAGGGNHSVFAKALLEVLNANSDILYQRQSRA